MTGNFDELAIFFIITGVVVAAISLAIIVNELAKIRHVLDKITDRTAKADDLIIENLEAIVWQTSETKNRIHSLDERISRFSQNREEQFVGELKDFLDENLVPLDKTND
jgi:hypothetical protein